jgi:allophanate hydrolase
MSTTQSLTLAALRTAYQSGQLSPVALVRSLYERIALTREYGIWITLVPQEQALAIARRLEASDRSALPLYGVPFAIKDNIDLAGTATTAGCPDFSYLPQDSAPVVARLIAAGAIPIGKTNLDQFATGLVGVRSPYGVCHNSIDPEFISGGSSSGSAVAVALGLVSFALGSDTAGSGRVPAAFNNIVGLKPTCGRLSPRGMVPACRSLDSLSIFTLSAQDASRVCTVAEGYDPQEPYSRRAAAPERCLPGAGEPFRFGVPRAEQLQYFGNVAYATLFEAAAVRLESLGGIRKVVDIEPLLETARLLYEGPWVAERYAATEAQFSRDPQQILPVTRQIIEPGRTASAVDAFRAQYRLQTLRRRAQPLWEDMDVLLTPTAPTHYRIAEVQADPVTLNSRLGYYTNFVNLLDLAALAVPAGFTPAGLPFGVTLVAPAWSDYALLRLGAALHGAADPTEGALGSPLGLESEFAFPCQGEEFHIAVCGAHMQGLALNHQLTQRGARLVKRTTTSASYRLYALPGGPPRRPGLVRVADGGHAIELEVWSLPVGAAGGFIAEIPAPLVIGKVALIDGSRVSGFLCEAEGLKEAADISAYGGWRAYLAGQA